MLFNCVLHMNMWKKTGTDSALSASILRTVCSVLLLPVFKFVLSRVLNRFDLIWLLQQMLISSLKTLLDISFHNVYSTTELEIEGSDSRWQLWDKYIKFVYLTIPWCNKIKGNHIVRENQQHSVARKTVVPWLQMLKLNSASEISHASSVSSGGW